MYLGGVSAPRGYLLGGCLFPGGVCSRGVWSGGSALGGSGPRGGVCYQGGLCSGGCLLPGGVCSQGVSGPRGGGVSALGVSAPGVVSAPRGVSALGVGVSALGGIPCALSHHAFDVTCMLPPHQLRHINCAAAAYIVWPRCMLGYTPTPTPCGQNHRHL